MPNPNPAAVPPRTRIIVVPLLRDPSGRVLLCKMAPDRGVFPGQWALPGGGLEAGERLEEALRREVREELGIELRSAAPLLFKDAVLEKTRADGGREPMHMIFLVYDCEPASLELTLNDEFSEALWAAPRDLAALSLTALTVGTLASAGIWPSSPGEAG